MSIKPALVERIFRGVWAANAADESDATDERRFVFTGDDSNGDGESTADDGDSARTAAQVQKIHSDSLKLSSEFLRLFVEEALRRAQVEAMIDDSATVEPHHVEQVVAQLLLDF